MIPTATRTFDLSVIPTIRKFGFAAIPLGRDATQIFNEISGITGNYGRYFASGDPLIPYSFSATNATDMIAQGVILRAALLSAIQAAVVAARSGNIQTVIPAIYVVTQALAACGATPGDQIRLMSLLAGFTAPTIAAGTDAIGLQILWLAQRTAAHIRISALASLTAATALYQPTSSNDAANIRTQVGNLIDAEMTLCAEIFDDIDYETLNQARIAVLADMASRGSILAPVIQKTFPKNLPSLVLAYRQYQDSTREPDLTARNDPINPLFMPLTVEMLAT